VIGSSLHSSQCLGLKKVDLQERLEVEVGDRVLVRHAQEAGQNTVGDDVALVGGVEARVRLHVVGHELRDLRLRALGASGQLHERAQLRGQAAGLQERVLRAAEFPRSLLLGRHVGNILLRLLALASLLHLLGSRLRRDQRVGNDLLQLVGQARAHLAEALNHATDRGRGRLHSGTLRRRRGRGGRRGSDRRDNHLRLGSRLARGLRGLGLSGGGRGRGCNHLGRRGDLGLGGGLLHGLRGIGVHVYNRGRRLCGHF